MLNQNNDEANIANNQEPDQAHRPQGDCAECSSSAESNASFERDEYSDHGTAIVHGEALAGDFIARNDYLERAQAAAEAAVLACANWKIQKDRVKKKSRQRKNRITLFMLHHRNKPMRFLFIVAQKARGEKRFHARMAAADIEWRENGRISVPFLFQRKERLL